MTASLKRRFDLNIEAMSCFQPELADLLRAEPIPDDVTIAKGRDGSETYRLRGDNGRSVWFGRSSMPTISAPAWLAGFKSDGGHVFVPGIHTGLEPLVLSERLPIFAAVFVAEPSLLAIKLALHLHDYVAVIAGRRIVFLHGDDVLASLRAFYDAHGGFDKPTQLVPAPDWTAADITECQQLLDRATGVIDAVHDAKIKQAGDALRARTPRPDSDNPSVAVLSVDTSPETLHHADRIGRALLTLDWPHAICIPDAPDRGHVTARLEAIRRSNADFALFVNSDAGRLRGILPNDIGIASWILDEACTGSLESAGSAGDCRFFAGSQSILEALIVAGLDREDITLCEPAADPTCSGGDDPFTEESQEVDTSVAVIADLPNDTPEAAGLTLASHLTLWSALREVADERVGGYDDAALEELAEMAQKRCGVALQDREIRSQFVEWLRSRIMPAALARASVDTLRESDHRFRVWGINWQDEEHLEDRYAGPIPRGRARHKLLTGTRVVVLPTTGMAAVQTALDALAMGRPVVWRMRREQLDRDFPALAVVSPYIHFYQSESELGEQVARLGSVPLGRDKQDREVMQLVRRAHTTVNRLLAIVETFH
ncbi:MAG: hypothetical protein IH987_06165 [Planctomycetes bacterium]|nr:hypothetical protein [Planctomycetota bacterium]